MVIKRKIPELQCYQSQLWLCKIFYQCNYVVVYQWRNLFIWHCSQCSLGLRIPSLHARHTQVLCFLVGHVCCMSNIPQYRLTPAEYKQPMIPSSYQLHHLVLRHLSQVVKNPPCSGFEPGTPRTNVRRSNHYTIKLFPIYLTQHNYVLVRICLQIWLLLCAAITTIYNNYYVASSLKDDNPRYFMEIGNILESYNSHILSVQRCCFWLRQSSSIYVKHRQLYLWNVLFFFSDSQRSIDDIKWYRQRIQGVNGNIPCVIRLSQKCRVLCAVHTMTQCRNITVTTYFYQCQ
jgi:hypothetical protein